MKKIRTKKIIIIASIILVVFILLNNIVYADTGNVEIYESLLTNDTEEEISKGNVTYPYGITKSMTKSDYWKKLVIDSNKLLMSKDEITNLNQEIVDGEGTKVVDLEKIQNPINVGFEKFYKNGELRQLYVNGNPINQEDYITKFEQGYSNIDSIMYAIVVKRADVKCWPTNDVVGYSITDPDDEIQDDSLNVNEPVVIRSKCIVDGELFYFCQSKCYGGWINADCLAICESKEEWKENSIFDINDTDILVVTESKITLEPSILVPSTSEVELMLGTVLKLVPEDDMPTNIGERGTWYNYVVYLPTRDEDGKFVKQYALISQKYNVSIGYLDFTQENLLDVAFTCLGDRYGWGSMLKSYDCSAYVKAIYKCFGFSIPRNTTWQQKIPGRVTDISGMTDEEKQSYFESIPVGSLLYFPGHTMMYVGSKDNMSYVISDTGSLSDSLGDVNVLSMYSVILNPLSVRRANGNTWLNNLKAVVTFGEVENTTEEDDNNKSNLEDDDKNKENTEDVKNENKEEKTNNEIDDIKLSFEDVNSSDWFYGAVKFAYSNGMILGYNNKTFAPNDKITRAMIVTILYRIEGTPDNNGISKFSDVSSNEWYSKAIKWAVDNGIIHGYEGSNSFGPNDYIIRQDLAGILRNYASYKKKNTNLSADLSKYKDYELIDEYALKSICWAVGAGVITGNDDGTLNPKGTATRAETAAMIQKYCSKVGI